MIDQNGNHITEQDAYFMGICSRECGDSRESNAFRDTDVEFVYWNRGYDDKEDNIKIHN